MVPTVVQINDSFNRRVRILEEPEGEDYWQTPTETIMLLSGDCEDYAIAKYFTLKLFEYDMREWELRAVRLKAEMHGGQAGKLINHALLVNTRTGWVLDNLAKEIVDVKQRIDIVETYAQIGVLHSSAYKQWHDMLVRRDVSVEQSLIRNFFGLPY